MVRSKPAFGYPPISEIEASYLELTARIDTLRLKRTPQCWRLGRIEAVTNSGSFLISAAPMGYC